MDWVFLPKLSGFFIRGKAWNSLFASRPLVFDVIALWIDFIAPDLPALTLASVQSSVQTAIVVISPADVCNHRRSFFFWVQMQFCFTQSQHNCFEFFVLRLWVVSPEVTWVIILLVNIVLWQEFVSIIYSELFEIKGTHLRSILQISVVHVILCWSLITPGDSYFI